MQKTGSPSEKPLLIYITKLMVDSLPIDQANTQQTEKHTLN